MGKKIKSNELTKTTKQASATADYIIVEYTDISNQFKHIVEIFDKKW